MNKGLSRYLGEVELNETERFVFTRTDVYKFSVVNLVGMDDIYYLYCNESFYLLE